MAWAFYDNVANQWHLLFCGISSLFIQSLVAPPRTTIMRMPFVFVMLVDCGFAFDSISFPVVHHTRREEEVNPVEPLPRKGNCMRLLLLINWLLIFVILLSRSK